MSFESRIDGTGCRIDANTQQRASCLRCESHTESAINAAPNSALFILWSSQIDVSTARGEALDAAPGRCLISSRSQANKINLRKINCLWILNILLRFKSSSSSGRYCESLVSETAHCDDQSLKKNESSDLRSSLHLTISLHTNSYIDYLRASLLF